MITILLFIIAASIIIGSRNTESFIDTKMDRLCRAISNLKNFTISQEVKERCLKHSHSKSLDYCIDGCDPGTLCGYPAFNQCRSLSSNCDITHVYVGPNFSVMNDNLPRIYFIKKGFCNVISVTDQEWPVFFTTPQFTEIMMCFPISITSTTINDIDYELTDAWTYKSTNRKYKVPLKEIPPRSDKLARLGVERSSPAKGAGFASFHSSQQPGHADTSFKMTEGDFVKFIKLHTEDRLDRSPNQLFVTFFANLQNNSEANNGYHNYKLGGGTLLSSVSGDIPTSSNNVSLLVTLKLNMLQGGVVEEQREIVKHGNEIQINFKKTPASEKRMLQKEDIASFSYILGIPGLKKIKALLQV